MTPDELVAIKARAEAATPGPWHWEGDNFRDEPESCSHGTEWTDHGPSLTAGKNTPITISWGYDASGLDIGRQDADFIAHAREDIPRLVAEVERLRAALESIAEDRPCGCGAHCTCAMWEAREALQSEVSP